MKDWRKAISVKFYGIDVVFLYDTNKKHQLPVLVIANMGIFGYVYILKNLNFSWVQWRIPLIPAL